MASDTPATIMIVEDENIVALDIRYSLEKLGYSVCAVVASGEEAIVYASVEEPDLILMDIELRGEMDGIEASDRIHQAQDVPIIYLTAYTDTKTLERAKITEPHGYVLKPFEERELHTIIEMSLYRHRMERQLRESEQWLRTTLHGIADAVIATDQAGKIRLVNPMAETLTGYRAAEALGKPLQEILRIEGEVELMDSALGIRLLGQQTYHDVSLITRANERRPIDGSVAHLHDNGRIVGVAVVFRDITEQKQNEKALRESEQRYRDLLEQTQLALLKSELHNQVNRSLISSVSMEEVLQSVVDGVSVALSDQLTFLHTLDPESHKIVRSVFSDSLQNYHLPGIDLDQFWEKLAVVLMEEKRPLQITFRADATRMQSRLLQVLDSRAFASLAAEAGAAMAAVPAPPAELPAQTGKAADSLAVVPIIYRGRLTGILGAISEASHSQEERDVELMMVIANQAAVAIENARLFEEAEERAKELSRTNAELEQFAYVASHDMQEPLRMIQAYAQLLERKWPNVPEDAQDFITQIVDGSRRMNSLIQDILAYSRVGYQPNIKNQVDLEELLARTVSYLTPLLQETGGQITHDPLPTLAVDPSQFQQLLQNLISNGLKFRSDEPPHVHISAQRLEKCWQFSVADNGIGIAPEFREQIFLAFRRLHSHSEFPGTGIGLAICKKIVEAHGGQIRVASGEEGGAVFVFTIADSPARG